MILYIPSRATLKRTFAAKYGDVVPRTPFSRTKIRNLYPLMETMSISAPFIWECPPGIPRRFLRKSKKIYLAIM